MNQSSKQRPRDKIGAVVLAAVDDAPAAAGVERCAADIALASKGAVVVFTVVPVPPQMHTRPTWSEFDEEDDDATGASVPVIEVGGGPFAPPAAAELAAAFALHPRSSRRFL